MSIIFYRDSFVKCLQYQKCLLKSLSNSAYPKNSVAFSSSEASSKASNVPTSESTESAEQEDWFNTMPEVDYEARVVPKPVNVMPDHLPQVRRRQVQKPWWKFRYFVDVNTLPLDTAEHTETPEYPEIFDTSSAGVKKQIRLEWYKAIGRLPSAQQKVYEITKHYQHLSYLIEPVMHQYNLLPIQQHITQTRLINSLPEQYQTKDVNVDDDLRKAILTSIATHLYSTTSRNAKIHFKNSSLSSLGFPTSDNFIQSTKEEDIISDVIHLVRSRYNNNLLKYQIDYNPNVATSWWLRDVPIPFIKKNWFKEDNIDQCFKYESTHALHVRSESPLPQIVPINDELCIKPLEIDGNYNLLKLGVPLRRRNIMSLPGFWLDKSDGFDFGNLLALSREKLRSRIMNNGRDFNDTQDVLDGMAILSSFSWLTSLASNLGFTLYHPLTYPLVTNVVITDGQHWSFYVYQLNNQAFHSDIVNDIYRYNLCWSSGDLKLFDSYEDGEFHGVNDEVLKIIIKMVNTPLVENVDYSLRPYLGVDKRSQREKDELSYSLRRCFAHYSDQFIARRKKVNLWETIYKNHNDSPLDYKRTRPKIELKYPPFFK